MDCNVGNRLKLSFTFRSLTGASREHLGEDTVGRALDYIGQKAQNTPEKCGKWNSADVALEMYAPYLPECALQQSISKI